MLISPTFRAFAGSDIIAVRGCHVEQQFSLRANILYCHFLCRKATGGRPVADKQVFNVMRLTAGPIQMSPTNPRLRRPLSLALVKARPVGWRSESAAAKRHPPGDDRLG